MVIVAAFIREATLFNEGANKVRRIRHESNKQNWERGVYMIVGNEVKSEQIKENDAMVNIQIRKHIVLRVIAFNIITVVMSGLYLG